MGPGRQIHHPNRGGIRRSFLNCCHLICRLTHFPAGTVEICVMGQNWRRYASASQSRTGLVSWHYPVCLAFLHLGCRHRSGKDRLSRPSSNVRQKWTTGPYHRHFDANHRLILASSATIWCPFQDSLGEIHIIPRAVSCRKAVLQRPLAYSDSCTIFSQRILEWTLWGRQTAKMGTSPDALVDSLPVTFRRTG